MIYRPTLIECRLLRRHKRFLADVELADGVTLRAHCANTGAMAGCSAPGSRAWLWDSGNPKRKYRHTLELVASGEHLVCVNTARANQVFAAALRSSLLPPLAGYAKLQREPRIPGGKGRFDFLLSDPERGDCFIELKSLTLGLEAGYGAFPDAVSERALNHVAELQRMLSPGEPRSTRRRAVLVFCVLHNGVETATTADDIQPAYGERLRIAMAAGVEVYAWQCQVSPRALTLGRRLPFVSPYIRAP